MPDPVQEAALARAAFAAGDVRHAVQHAGNALIGPPWSAEAVTLLDDMLRASSDPLAATDPEPRQVSTVLVRARALVLVGRLGEAAMLLVQVLLYDPGPPYLRWVVAEIERDPSLAAQIDPGALAGLVAENLGRIQSRAAYERLSAMFEALGQPKDPRVAGIAVAVHRRAGCHELAIAVARTAFEAGPSWDTATSLARALRSAGRLDEAERAYLEGQRLEPSDATVFLDCGDMWVGEGRLAEARAYYDRVLEVTRGHPWAAGAVQALDVLDRALDPSPGLAVLANVAAPERANAIRQLTSSAEFAAWLPMPPDLVPKSLERARSQLEPGVTLQLKLDYPEASSTALVIDLIRRRTGADAVVLVTGTPDPDPRLPRAKLAVPLWRTSPGGRPEPAIPAPGESVEAVVALARGPFRVAPWWQKGREIGRRIGPEQAEQLLRLMVHPPDPPESWFEGRWVFQVQVAAAFALAGVDAGWDGSVRRRLLLDLLRGPMDWTVGAAALALARIAREGDGQTEIEAEFRALAEAAARYRFCSFGPALTAAASWLPNRSARLDAALETIRS